MIFVECRPDLILVQVLRRFPRKSIIHELKGKGAICGQLSKKTASVALLDEDPGSPQPSYIKKASLYRLIEEHDIKILHDNGKNNSLILLMPSLEYWVLRAVRLASLDVRSYGLPENGNELHRIINYRLDKYRELLTDLILQKSPMLVSLKAALGK